MKTHRKKIKLSPHEDRTLAFIYFNAGIPTDQYHQRPRALADTCEAFRAVTGSLADDDAILHYMMCQRKAGKWPTFDGAHQRLACPPEDMLTDSQRASLIDLYERMAVGTDQYGVDEALRDQLAGEFQDVSGRLIPGRILYAYLMALRKAGLLPRINGRDDGPDTGFRDIDKVA